MRKSVKRTIICALGFHSFLRGILCYNRETIGLKTCAYCLKVKEVILVKEVGFGGRASITCSICNLELKDCEHLKGEIYDGKECFGIINDFKLYETSILENPTKPLKEEKSD